MVIHTLKRLIPDTHPLRLLWHRVKACLAALRYGFPARHLCIIGITGTDGKTTTVGMLAHILHAQNIHAGALSTAFFQIDGKITWNATQKTSPSPFLIQKFLRDLVAQGCTHTVLEYSSHGLVQGRMLFTWPQVAAITNLSEEHLDYHGTMSAYLHAKSLLFSMLRTDGTKVLNATDPSYALLKDIPTAHTELYSLTADRSPLSLTLSIPGAFNIQNALCAIACAKAVGIKEEDAVQAVRSFPGVPGRMERIDEGQPFSVYIDFTVTPQSYEKTLSTLKEMLPAGKKLLVLMGSCGDRMREKRPIIGKIASTFADQIVVTNEDPYTEDPARIIDEVWAGIDQTAVQAHRIEDRREAIAFLLKQAMPGDIVIFCGKGSDTTMWVKGGKIDWNEREIVRSFLSAAQERTKESLQQ